MALELKNSLNETHDARKFASILEKLSVHCYSELVDGFSQTFCCVSCSQIPGNVCYVSSVCQHCFCGDCVKKESFDICPSCKTRITKKDLFADPQFWLYSQCLKKKKSIALFPTNKTTSVDYLLSIKRPSRYDFLLQEECRKLFLKGPQKTNPVDIENIKLLLNFGANPNVLNKDGGTLLHEAVDYGHTGVLEVLLEGGGLVNAYSLDRVTTCLHDALDDPVVNTNVVHLLLQYGADMQARDRGGVTAEKKAATRGIDLSGIVPKIPMDILVKHKPEEPPLIFAQLSQKNQKVMNDFCQKFKMKMHQCPKLSREVTHVVVDEDPCQPTPAVLQGILQGCFILTAKWLKESLREGELQEAERFEVEGTKDFPDTGVPARARISSMLLEPKLFAGGQINIMDVDRAIRPQERNELAELIASGGGKLLTRTSSCAESIGESFFYHAHGGPLELSSVIVLHRSEAPASSSAAAARGAFNPIRWLPVEWLYRAIQTYTIVP